MTESYGFFASAEGDQRLITQSTLAELIKNICRNGVHHAVGGALQVQPNIPESLSVTVSTGFALVEGYWYKNDAIKTIPLAAADPASPRIDRVVLRADKLADRTVEALVLTGTPAAAPEPPVLVRDSSVYDLGLATVAVPAGAVVAGEITDTRRTPDTCGYMEPWVVTETSFYPTAAVSFNGQRITGLGAPSAATDAANKAYVDSKLPDPDDDDWVYQGLYAGDMIMMAGHVGHLTDFGASPNGRHVYGRGNPAQWLYCNGAEVKKSDYPDLWTALDDGGAGHYGACVGGSSYFRLPQATGNVLGFYHDAAVGWNDIGQITPTAELHATLSSGTQNIPQWLVVGGLLIKTGR